VEAVARWCNRPEQLGLAVPSASNGRPPSRNRRFRGSRNAPQPRRRSRRRRRPNCRALAARPSPPHRIAASLPLPRARSNAAACAAMMTMISATSPTSTSPSRVSQNHLNLGADARCESAGARAGSLVHYDRRPASPHTLTAFCAASPILALHSFLTVCIGCKPCRPQATYVHVGFSAWQQEKGAAPLNSS
jgi:hypothetical protein